MRRAIFAALLLLPSMAIQAETPEEWITLGARVHGAFGAFHPAWHQDRSRRSQAPRRQAARIGGYLLRQQRVAVRLLCRRDRHCDLRFGRTAHFDHRARESKAPDGTLAVVIVRPRKGGPGFKYTIPASDLAKLGPMNKSLDPQGRWDAVMKEDGLFAVEEAP
jgi:hypothetical protein